MKQHAYSAAVCSCIVTT